MYGFSICRMQRAYGGSPLVKSASNVFDKTLVSAVERGDLQKARHLIRSGSSPSVTDDHGRTPLMHAVLRNDVEAAQAIMEGTQFKQTAHIHARDKDGRTCLDYWEDKRKEWGRGGPSGCQRMEAQLIRFGARRGEDLSTFARLSGTRAGLG